MKLRPYLMGLCIIGSLLFSPACNGDRDIDCEYFEDCNGTPANSKSQVVITYSMAYGSHAVSVYINNEYKGAAPPYSLQNLSCETGPMIFPLQVGTSYTIYGYSSTYGASSTFSFVALENTCHLVNINL